jgi:prophage DNA circulation protein
MSWAESLRKASFRGVPFSVRAHESDFGRRVQVHEFPDRDKPFAEDLGRKARVISLDAFVLGDDYMLARDRLLVAVEQPGVGVLVHPYLGELRATVLRAKLAESTPEGGMARLTLEFVESGDAEFPNASTSTTAAASSKAEAASKAAQASFTARHSVADKPQFVTDTASSIFTRALNSYTAAVGTVRAVASQVAVLQQQVNAAKSAVTTLLFAPASAAQALVGNL